MAKKELSVNEKNPFVAISLGLGGMLLVIVIIFIVLAQSMMVHMWSITAGFVALGFIGMLFTYLSQRK